MGSIVEEAVSRLRERKRRLRSVGIIPDVRWELEEIREVVGEDPKLIAKVYLKAQQDPDPFEEFLLHLIREKVQNADSLEEKLTVAETTVVDLIGDPEYQELFADWTIRKLLGKLLSE